MGSILGIGVDVVDVKRMKTAVDAWGPALIKQDVYRYGSGIL